MNDPQQEGKKYILSNLIIESIGLVRRGANRKPFMFVKSATGQPEQGEDMSDEKQDVKVEAPTDEEIQEFRDWKVGQSEKPTAEEVPAVLESTVDFAEMLALQEKRMSEDFAAKLEAEQVKTAKLTEAFAEEQNKRRLMQFTDQAATFDNLSIGAEVFGEDLMAMADNLPEETFDRIVRVLRAANEAIEQGSLFNQFAQPAQGETGDPFLSKVTVIKNKLLESDPRKDSNEAFADAVKLAQERHPDLAARYAKGGA